MKTRALSKAHVTQVRVQINAPSALFRGDMASNGQQSAKLEKLQFQLEAFIESLRTVGVIAGDFQQNGQTNFNEKL